METTEKTYEQKRKEATKKLVKKIIIGVVIFIAVVLFFNSLTIVRAGQRGVVLTWGAVSDTIFDEGLHFKIPIAQRVKKIDVRIQKDEVPAAAASKDLQVVTSTIALNYHLDPNQVNKVWQEVGKDYNSRIIAPSIQEAVKATTAKFTAEELITKREEVKEAIKLSLTDRLIVRGIIVDEFNIVDFDFSRAFNEAIEMKVTAEQLKLKADRDLERIKIEKEQIITAAQGKAEAIRIEAQALLQNPKVVQLRAIEKWNGILPLYTGGDSIPLISLNK